MEMEPTFVTVPGKVADELAPVVNDRSPVRPPPPSNPPTVRLADAPSVSAWL